MKKLILLILVSVAVYGNDVEKYDMNISVKEFGKRCYELKGKINQWDKSYRTIFARNVQIENCKLYIAFIRKGCSLGSGQCCENLADEYNPITTNWELTLRIDSGVREFITYTYWIPKFGSSCYIRDKNESLKYYRKSCELGNSYACEQHTTIQNTPNLKDDWRDLPEEKLRELREYR